MARIFKPRPKPVYTLDIGNKAIKAEFFVDKNNINNCYLNITARESPFMHRVSGDTFGYLLTAVADGREDEVEAYCAMIWRVSSQVYSDPDFCSDIVSAINNLDNRLFEQAVKGAEEVTESSNMADEALMMQVVSETTMTAKEREASRREFRKGLDEVVEAINNRDA